MTQLPSAPEKGLPKPSIVLHGDLPDQSLTKAVWSLLAGQDVRIVNTDTIDNLENIAPDALLIMVLVGTDREKAADLASRLCSRKNIVADLVAILPEASAEERIKILSYGYDSIFIYEFMQFKDFRRVLLNKIERARIRLQNRTQEEEYRRFRASLAASPDAFIVFDENRKIFFVSEHYRRAYPRKAERMVRGLDVMDAFEMLSGDQGVSPGDARYEKMKEFWAKLDGQQEFTLDDGRTWRMTAAKLDEGRGTIVTTTDITYYLKQKRDIEEKSRELTEALAKEQEASSLQKQFVNMVSHEFRTPLSIIDGHTQILNRRADELTPDDIRTRAKIIRSAVARLITMMEGVLSSNLLKTGHLQIVPEDLDVATFMKDLCDDYAALASGKLQFEVKIGSLPETLKIDKKILLLIITNLLSNAMKFSGESRIIQFTADYIDQKLVFSVQDFGVGIPRDEIPRIFDRYYRAKTSTGVPGTGLGLSLVKDLVGLYRGSIEVESDAGKGAKFVISLPVLAK